MRKSKYVGFLAIGLGALLMVGAAILPVSPSTQRFGPFKVDIGGDNCGPAGVAAVQKAGTECGTAARRRLLTTSAIGVLTVAFGMALFAGGDGIDHSRIAVPTRRVRRRSSLWSLVRSPGSRRCTPG